MITDTSLKQVQGMLMVTSEIPQKTEASIYIAASNDLMRREPKFADRWRKVGRSGRGKFEKTSVLLKAGGYRDLRKGLMTAMSTTWKLDEKAVAVAEGKTIFFIQGRGKRKGSAPFMWSAVIRLP